MDIKLKSCDVRSWRLGDAGRWPRHGKNRKIWINLRDAFPHPVHIDDAREVHPSLATARPRRPCDQRHERRNARQRAASSCCATTWSA